jgi:hypothetical protein
VQPAFAIASYRPLSTGISSHLCFKKAMYASVLNHGKVMKNHFAVLLLVTTLMFAYGLAHAGEADVIAATAKRNADGTYRIDATIKSRDTGWDYYAERFEVIGQDGKILATRVLLHPHENEQPFTRELDNVKIPAGVTEVKVRALMKRKGKSENEKHDGQVATLAGLGK